MCLKILLALLVIVTAVIWHTYPDLYYHDLQKKIVQSKIRKGKKFNYYIFRSDRENDTLQHRNWRIQNIIASSSVLLTAIVAIFAFGTYYETKKQAEAANTMLALSYPPKFRFVDFELAGIDGSDIIEFDAGRELKVHGEFLELGRSEVVVTLAVCQIYWGSRFLPMHRPYMHDGIPSSCPIKNSASSGLLPFKPGDFGWFDVTSRVPKNINNSTILYVMGFFAFKDDITPVRYSIFARRYDTEQRRFVKVNNSDYEREDEQALEEK